MTLYTPNFPLYHGLTIDRFVDHVEKGRIGAHSRFHLDATGQLKGTWVADDFNYVIENKHGVEFSDELLMEIDWSHIPVVGRKIQQMKMRTRIIAEFDRVPDNNAMLEHFLPHQFFYVGEIPTDCISRVYLDQQHAQMWKERDRMRLVSAGIPESKIEIYSPLRK